MADEFWDYGPSYDYSGVDVPSDYNFFEPSALNDTALPSDFLNSLGLGDLVSGALSGGYTPIDYSSLASIGSSLGNPMNFSQLGVTPTVTFDPLTGTINYADTTGLLGDNISFNLDTGEWVTPAASSSGSGIGYHDNEGNFISDKFGIGSSSGEIPVSSTKTPQERIAESAAKMMEQLVVNQAKAQAAKAAYANSGVGQAASGLAMAAKLYQDLAGKNKGATTSARSNQGQSFTPAYVGSSTPKTKYASGGKVNHPKAGGLLSVASKMVDMLENQGRKGLIGGEEGGQDDVVELLAAPGEYIMDADVVSSLGDGNNEAGAKKLDQMRINIRKHKRQGGLTSIPPKAKSPEKYLE